MSRSLIALLTLSLAAAVVLACGGESDGDAEGDGTAGSGGTDMETQPEYEVVICEEAPTTSGDGVCTVEPGDGRMALVGDVLAGETVYEQGVVLLDANGIISCVGCDCLDSAEGATQVICNDAVISPGLIDAHDHVGWMNGKPWVAGDSNGVDSELRWEHRHDWRTGSRGQPEVDVDGGGASEEEKTLGDLRFALSGTTSKFGSGDTGGFLRDLDSTGSGSNGLGQPGAVYSTFPLGDADGVQLEEGCTSYDIDSNIPSSVDAYAPHVSEGIDQVARNEFACLTGQGAGSEDVLDDRAALIHGVGLTPIEIGQMATKGIDVIWSPRSNISLYGDTAPVTVYDAMGVSIGLGADWIPSGSMNMLRELRCAADFNDGYLGGYFSHYRLWQMATYGSAKALGFEDATGSLSNGLAGDIAIFAKNENEAYEAVLEAGVDDVALVLKGGEVLNGNKAIVDALESDCDSLDVCGVEKGVCFQARVGSTLGALQASADMQYPLFFCGVPEDEPTCVPQRIQSSDQIGGSSLYAGTSSLDDPDSDGIPDEMDNCPTIFNPIRPLDQGSQADADADGVGDACDPCPLDAGTDTCTPFDPNDPDGDGIANAADNCPSNSNEGQEDEDGDGKGDVCDACPSDANPGGASCPGIEATIYELQDESDPNHPADGTTVRISCVITAVGENLAWCQDAMGGQYSGIAMYFGSTPEYADGSSLSVGDAVFIDGDLDEFSGGTQLANPSVTANGMGTVPTPIVVSASDLAGPLGPEYEGVLVEVQEVSVTNENPDAPDDFDEFEVTGGLRIDDLAYPTLDNTYAEGTSFSSIVGVHHFSFGNFKVLPRSADDLTEE